VINLESYQKVNLILWIAILSGIIILTVIALLLNKFQPFQEDFNLPLITEILFGMAIVIAIAILVLKRSIFRLDKIVVTGSGLLPIETQVNYVLAQLRRNYIILWALAEAIGTIGFVYYIITSNLHNYLLCALVSIFSLASNFPRRDTINNCLANLGYYGPTA
jgi:uncharacterized membrane protein YdcZ (DUF606 family)